MTSRLPLEYVGPYSGRASRILGKGCRAKKGCRISLQLLTPGTSPDETVLYLVYYGRALGETSKPERL